MSEETTEAGLAPHQQPAGLVEEREELADQEDQQESPGTAGRPGGGAGHHHQAGHRGQAPQHQVAGGEFYQETGGRTSVETAGKHPPVLGVIKILQTGHLLDNIEKSQHQVGLIEQPAENSLVNISGRSELAVVS